MQKNVASQKWVVFAFDRTDNTPKTGDAGNITANLRIDGGAVNAVDDTNPTELEDGFYVFDLTAAETNGDYILISPASATSDIQVIGCPAAVFTTPANFQSLGIESDGDVTKVNTLDGHTAQTGDSYSIVNGDHGLVSIQDDVDAILADTNELQGNQGNWATATGFSTHSAADVKTAIEQAGSSIAQILEDTGTTLPASITALNDISVADIIAGIADGTYDLQEMLRIMFAALAGKSAGGGTGTITFRDSADTKDRISATVDSNGNRTVSPTLDGS